MTAASSRPKVLVISPEPVAERMAGPAIRAYELARAMRGHCDVTLAAPPPSSPPENDVELLETAMEGDRDLDRALRGQDVVVAQIWPSSRIRYLARRSHRLVIDMYCPIYFESLESSTAQSDRSRHSWHRWMAREIGNALMAADYIVCASERQRDLLLGAMMVTGRIDPGTYTEDRSFRSVIDVVPFGMSDEPPRHTKAVVKGVIPGIRPEDRVLLWGGGVWNWLDPLTALRAMEIVARRRDDVKLLFMSLSRSHAVEKIDFSAAAQALRYARDRDLEDKFVFLQSEWVSYAERANYLLESDLGISTHHDHLETRFSLRSRLLDCVWAGLPIVSTQGDASAEWIERYGLGATVPAEDPDALAGACLGLLDDPSAYAQAKSNLQAFGRTRTWSKVAEPLVDYAIRAHSLPRRRREQTALRLRAARQFPRRLHAVYLRDGPVSLTRFAVAKLLSAGRNGGRR